MENNPQLENGYTRIANEIVETMCKLKISNYESRFLWCLFRKTYGFGKKQDYIALSQFAKLSGIESQHIARTKTRLVSKNIITVSGGKIGFQKDVSKWVVPNEVVPIQVVPKQVRSSTQTGSQLVPIQVDTKETLTKETIQKKYTSIKNLTEKDFEEISNDYGVTIQFVRSKFEDLQNYCGAKGKKYSNYKLALRNFVKKAFEEKGGKLKMPTEELKLKRQQLIRQFGINN